MTGRERLIKTFKCEKVDRIPVAPFLNFNAVCRHFDISPKKQNWRGNHNLVEKAIELSVFFGFGQLQRLDCPIHIYDERNSDDGRWRVEIEYAREDDVKEKQNIRLAGYPGSGNSDGFYKDFVLFLKGDKKEFLSMHDAAKSMKILDMIRESGKKNNYVSF